jgi:hypothetical protein
MVLRRARSANAPPRNLCRSPPFRSGEHRLQRRQRDAQFDHIAPTQLVRRRIQIHSRRVLDQFIPGLIDVPVGEEYGRRDQARVGVLGLLDDLLTRLIPDVILQRRRFPHGTSCRLMCWHPLRQEHHQFKRCRGGLIVTLLC